MPHTRDAPSPCRQSRFLWPKKESHRVFGAQHVSRLPFALHRRRSTTLTIPRRRHFDSASAMFRLALWRVAPRCRPSRVCAALGAHRAHHDRPHTCESRVYNRRFALDVRAKSDKYRLPKIDDFARRQIKRAVDIDAREKLLRDGHFYTIFVGDDVANFVDCNSFIAIFIEILNFCLLNEYANSRTYAEMIVDEFDRAEAYEPHKIGELHFVEEVGVILIGDLKKQHKGGCVPKNCR